ncbi:MAG TPA: phosphoglycerate kinase, partial [Candidatus Gracilibacteria bacterium]|nr:phosphoglycerate kinase [Candidatus Gracilibacteria bacterium]
MSHLNILPLADLEEQTVICRVDYNVPLENGEIQGDWRIKASLDTLAYLRRQNCKIIVISHLGRPQGKDSRYSLKPVQARLEELIGHTFFWDGGFGKDLLERIQQMSPQDILVLENLRFEPGEEKNDPDLAHRLSELGDIFVEEGFGVTHRAHASTVGISKFLPSYAGFLVEQEVYNLRQIRDLAPEPFALVMGGAKIETKIPLIKSFLDKAES